MFSFDNDRWTIRTGENMVSIPVCKYGDIFNTVSNECAKMKCPKYYRLQKSKCVYNVKLITSPAELNRSHLNIDIIISYPLMENTSLNLRTCSQQSVIDNLIANATLLSVKNTNGSMTMEFGLQEDDVIDLQKIPQFIKCSSSVLLVMRNYDNVRDLYCPHGMLLNRTVTGHIFLHDVFARPFNLTTNISTFMYVSQLKFAFSESAKETSLDIWYCENEEKVLPINCSVFLTYENQSFEIRNNKAYLSEFDKSFENDSYFVEDSVLFTCEEKRMEKVKSEFYFVFLSSLTLSCFAVSLFSLVVVISVYCYHRELRNLHGICIISFSIVLAIVQSLILFQKLIPEVMCRTIAILSHYLWLAVFVWSAVMAFDLARKFNIWTMMKLRKINENMRFIKYSLVSWISPLIPVIACVILDVYSDGEYVGYGRGNLSMCWMENTRARMYFYIIPCAVILSGNIVLLLTVVCGIESTKRTSKNIQKSQKNDGRCLIYTKISVIIGLSWIIAYVAQIIKTDWMFVLYTVVSGLQGFFVLLGVVACNRKARRLFCRQENNSKASLVSSSVYMCSKEHDNAH